MRERMHSIRGPLGTLQRPILLPTRPFTSRISAWMCVRQCVGGGPCKPQRITTEQSHLSSTRLAAYDAASSTGAPGEICGKYAYGLQLCFSCAFSDAQCVLCFQNMKKFCQHQNTECCFTFRLTWSCHALYSKALPILHVQMQAWRVKCHTAMHFQGS